jgi:hypothetical protein
MEFSDYIGEFISDAQYRIGELTCQIDDKRRSNLDYEDEKLMRLELSTWISVLYEHYMKIYDSFNFMNNWTENNIKDECEYLRIKTKMLRIPYFSFASYTPQFVTVQVVPGGDTELPSGTYKQVIAYNSSNQPIAQDAPDIGGMSNLTINQYFT